MNREHPERPLIWQRTDKIEYESNEVKGPTYTYARKLTSLLDAQPHQNMGDEVIQASPEVAYYARRRVFGNGQKTEATYHVQSDVISRIDNVAITGQIHRVIGEPSMYLSTSAHAYQVNEHDRYVIDSDGFVTDYEDVSRDVTAKEAQGVKLTLEQIVYAMEDERRALLAKEPHTRLGKLAARLNRKTD